MENTAQNKREKDTSYHPEMHVRDVNIREIFKSDILASQFLRNYTNIPLFSEVTPEDIEDVSSKYRAFLGVEYESDTIKKVYIRKQDGTIEREIYVVSLIEHKSDIDYDVAMQLLRYMCAIWQEYKVTQNKLHSGSNTRKSFRYPLIIPIVYYEGKQKWTADLHLKSRIEFPEGMEQYIPDFIYQVVSINQYTNDELSKIHDEMSLVMMINKMQTSDEVKQFFSITEELVNSIYGNAPDEIKEIYRKVLWSLLMKMNVPSEDAKEIIDGIGGHGMGFLFENMDKIDIQAERELAQKERAEAQKERENAQREKENAQRERENAQRERENAQRERERADALELELEKLRQELNLLKETQNSQ